MDYKERTIDFLAERLELDKQELASYLEIPPQENMGDFALPCFRYAKTLRKAPQKIAEDFAAKLSELPDFVSEVRSSGAYLNLFLARDVYCADMVREALTEGADYAASDAALGKKILVEFSSPNIAKPFHVGHAFSTFLGDVLARIYEHLGADVVRLNHLGDYGTQFGKLIVAYDRWGDEEALKKSPISELLRIYVKFHKAAELEPELDDEARARFKALEEGSEHELALWQRFRDLSLEEFGRIYERIDVHFDSNKGEAFYSDMIPAVVEDLEKKGLLEDSEGAKVVQLDEDIPPCIVLKSDGSTIYATRDLAAAIYRYNTYHFDKNIYVVGLPQSLHFRQVFATLKKAGYEWADDCVHVGFGLVKFPPDEQGGITLSTRSGNVIYLEDLLDEAVAKTKAIIIENNASAPEPMSEKEIEETANAIGLGAIRYTFLRSGRERDIIFRWDEILDFEGDSAPYMQYAYARAQSILRRSAADLAELKKPEELELGSDSEFALCREMDQIRPAILQAAANYEPSILARQCMSMCRAFSRFYNQMPILQAENEELKRSRLSLCLAFSSVLKTTLALLGIKTVDRM